jgi:hypothetical protein
MSFLKFQEDPNSDKDLHWQRADRDGAPFKGSSIPLLKEEEFEELAERVHDCQVAILDVNDPEDGVTYKRIMDGCRCGYFHLLAPRKYKWVERKGKLTMMVYVEWAQTTMQLPKRVVEQLRTTVTPIEGEVNYAKSSNHTSSQPRPLRQGTQVRER